MIGKADMLLATRTLSALVVICVVLSAFAGFMFFSGPTPTKAAAGDLIVTGTYIIEDIEQPVDGDVIVQNGGHLIIRDASIGIISNNDPALMHSVTVQAGGTITLDHGMITTYVDQIDPWPFLDMVVSGGSLIATNFSELMFPGTLTFQNGASVSLTDTWIHALPDWLITDFLIGSGGAISMDTADDGPNMTISSSTLMLYDSAIEDIPEYPLNAVAASNIELTGTSTLLAVNSYIGVDFGPALTTPQTYTHNALELSDTSTAHLYGCYFEDYYGANADRAPAVISNGDTYIGLPTAAEVPPGDTTVGQSVSSLWVSGEGMTYHVAPAEIMGINTFGAGAPGIPVDGASLLVRYKVDPGYGGNNPVLFSINEGGIYQSTGIVPSNADTSFVDASCDLFAGGATTTTLLGALDIRFVNNGASHVQFDSMALVISIGPEVYVYRWLNLTVGDEYGVPISNSKVSAVFTGSSSYGGQPAFYFGFDGIGPYPPVQVLDYMGQDESTFATTDDFGMASIPYLSDIVAGGQAPNSLFVGVYELTGSYGTAQSTQSFSFTPYPAMSSSDQNFEFTVSIEGVSATSPDPSRWLVVPPSLEIQDMTYYHAGDVIVAANGILTFTNAVFQIVQTEAYEHTIYVDNSSGLPTKLVFRDSELLSSMPIQIFVKGMATLEVINSTLNNVMIVALEKSNVVLESATVNGAITTEWNSDVDLTVTDSLVTDTPVLAGTSRGYFTDSWVPSVDVTDDAIAHIYRWINVQVQDGAGMPLPSADVSIRQYVSGVPGGSAVSSESEGSLGVASVKSEATQITALGRRTYLGNYWINATYTHGSIHYTDEISVGVLPYSEPLSPNASYVVMQFDDVFPDLTVHASPPPQVEFDVASPSPGDEVGITARISNDGTGYAWDVVVAFYDDLDKSTTAQLSELIGSAVIPMIRPGETQTASVTWVATTPVDPNSHVIIAVADPDNEIIESNEAVAQGTGTIIVRSLPDLYVLSGINEVTTSVSPVVVNSTVQLMALIHNGGSNTSLGVVVEFYDEGAYFATAVLDVAANGVNIATVPWTPTSVADHVIKIAVDPGNLIEELVDLGATNYNNNVSLAITVLDYPDITISGPTVTPAGSVPGGSTVVVTALVSNLNPAPISLPEVKLYYNYTDQAFEQEITLNVYGFTKDSGVAPATFSFVAPVLNATTPVSLVLIVNPTGTDPIETRYSNNIVIGSVEVLDVRPDLAIASNDIYVQLGGTNRTGETFGKVVTVYANVWNMGGSNATNVRVQIGVRSTGFATVYNFTSIHIGNFYNVSYSSPNNKVLVSTAWTINLTTPGSYEIWVHVDGMKSIDEPNEDNNWAVKPFTIQPLVVDVVIAADDDEYKAGESIVIVAQITYDGTSDAVKRLPGVAFELYNLADPKDAVLGSRTANQTTDDGGVVNVLLLIPSNIATGSYGVRAVILTSNYESDPATTVHVSAAVSGGFLPLWLILLIVVAVVGVVAGFFVYTYVYGLGKLVECGECGAFIPAASKRCPKCGVEFESGTMKCSECGAWIPAASAECPNCGVKFVGEVAAEEDYMERMRAQYEDQVVSKYRELARPELGRKYNDKTFEAWWRRQPGYISFEDWLAKEEEKKKEGPVPCPVCGTLNPKEATVCHKCGTVFAPSGVMPPRKGPPPAGTAPTTAAEEEQPVQEAGMPVLGVPPAGGAPRMVIRRPIDRKVVPKKIIKTPLGEEKTEGGENQ